MTALVGPILGSVHQQLLASPYELRLCRLERLQPAFCFYIMVCSNLKELMKIQSCLLIARKKKNGGQQVAECGQSQLGSLSMILLSSQLQRVCA